MRVLLSIILVFLLSLPSFAGLHVFAQYKTKEGNEWRVDIEVDDDQGNRYHTASYFRHEPTQEEIDNLTKRFISELKKQLEYQKNPLNELPSIEEMEYKELLACIVKNIRSNPDISLLNLKKACSSYSYFNLEKLQQFLMKRANINSFDKFKTFIINHKFEGID